MGLVELARFNTRVEADLARLRLEQDGIEAILFDSETATFFGASPLMPVRLMVIEEDLADAAEILRADD